MGNNANQLRVASAMLAALTNNDDPKAARLRAVIRDSHTLTLDTVQQVCGLLGVTPASFFTKETA